MPVNKGTCHGQEKAHVLRAFDVRQQAEVILVLTSASLCSGQLRRWKRDANLQKATCEVSTPGDVLRGRGIGEGLTARPRRGLSQLAIHGKAQTCLSQARS